jgi:methyl-accepting chemotaxis protein
MKWTIGAKIGAAFASALAIVSLFGVVCYQSMVKLTDAARWVEQTHLVIDAVVEVTLGIVDAEAAARGFVISGDARFLELHENAQRKARAGLSRFRELGRNSAAQQRRSAALEPLVSSRLADLASMIDARQRQGFDAAARVLSDERTKTTNLEVRRLIQEARDTENALRLERGHEAREHAERTESTIVWAIAGAAVLLVVLGFLLSLNIARPLGQISEAAQRIATGDLEVALPAVARDDEVGALIHAFRHMTQALGEVSRVATRIASGDLSEAIKPQSERDSVGKAFVTMREGLRRSTGELRDAAVVLAASASEILAASSQVAASAAETATAVTETTTTVEEVKQTAQVASQKARLVSENALKATQTSQEGRRAVDDSIEGMHRIREQMGSIAETVVKLSEQSQAIGDIVASVTDLAEQSNLLAVNAAIEAARAGEHGKGFSVVAQEVKSLADQSKHATAQVRAILNDIQKAISSAVMATEQGSKSVEAGVLQSQEASDAIRSLASTIEAGSQAALQIAASSQQQSVGMDQVATAMDSIKRASVQNVSGTRQTEVAAKNLHDVGLKLKELVERYRV